ncbi:MAG: hypothetical protein LBU83_04715 [Bacteroidales bacterium]|jgi:sulfur relay (sulfurtransferase) DsrC/TusE family protein|nr:hypothetical protein [Bacteroidales bacterium]
MAKQSKKTSFFIHDFFGTYNSYKIFALQSELSILPFANQLGKKINTNFSLLPDFEFTSNKFVAFFSVLYAEFNHEEAIHLLLLENKTVNFNQQDYLISKSEKKLPFQTLYLFEEWLYLFNNQGLHCFDFVLPNMDYLLLLFAKKDIDNEVFSHLLKNITPYNVQNVSYLIEKEQTASEKKIVSLLRDFFCKYEVKANYFSRKKKMDILAPIKQVPNQNLQFPIPILLENNSIADNLQLGKENLEILKGE